MKIIPSFLIPFIGYKIIFTVWVGSFLTFLNIEISARLDSITEETKEIIFYFTSYSIFILILMIFLFVKKNIKYQKKYSTESVYKKFSIYLILIIIFYSLYILLIERNKLPILHLINGDLIQAAYVRMLIQTHEIKIGILYLSKFIFYMNLFLPIFLLIKLLESSENIYKYLFIISLLLSFFNLTLDLQKSYVMILILLLFFVYVYIKGVNMRLILYIILVSVGISYLISFIMGKEDLLSALLYIIDRTVFGQNQAMYFLYQYYEPNLEGVLADFYFSSTLGLDNIKPDEYILSYLYDNIDNLVNVNTYYLGESWSFFSYYGLFFMPFFVSFNIIMYAFLFNKLFKYDYLIFWVVALVFFATLPIDQSLQFIIYQKYLLYFLFFFIIPIFMILTISKIKWQRK